jgi:Flp pilus assembly protein TadB
MIDKWQRLIIISLYATCFIYLGLKLLDSLLIFPYMLLGILLANTIRKHFFNKRRWLYADFFDILL